jgi:hypothetical protein
LPCYEPEWGCTIRVTEENESKSAKARECESSAGVEIEQHVEESNIGYKKARERGVLVDEGERAWCVGG